MKVNFKCQTAQVGAYYNSLRAQRSYRTYYIHLTRNKARTG